MTVFPGGRIIRAASRLVPALRRDAWRREWQAEAAYAWTRARSEGRAGPATALRLRLRALTCIVDALIERKASMTFSGMLNDVRHALRGLIRKPVFTGVAVLTLALGIGANTAVFSLVDGVLLRPLPFPESDRLVRLDHLGRDGQDALPISSGLYLLYRDQSATLEGVAMFVQTAVNLVSEGQPERVLGQSVTPEFFSVLGVEPALGRAFVPEEGIPDARQVVLLSDGLWRSRFGADPTIVGRSVEMSGVGREVVGVMAPDFGYPDRGARFWVPLVVDPTNAPLAAFFAGGIGRIAGGSSIDAVQSELGGMMTRLEELFPESGGARFLTEVGLKSLVIPLKESLVGDVSTTLWILLGTVGFVLLIACANVANLLLVRAEGRQREMALRVAVGAGRWQVLRSSMAESLALALVGGALAVALARGALSLTAGFMPTDLPRMAEVGIDPRVLGFTGLVALGCAAFFGLFPLLRYGIDDLSSQLRDGGGARGTTGGRERHRLRNGLVVTQVGLALVLLVGAGLMFRSFVELRNVDPGFDPDGVFTARIVVPAGEIEGGPETAAFFRQLQQRLAVLPGVEAAGLVSAVPLSGNGVSFGGIEVEDHPRGPDELPVFASLPQAEVGYLETMRIGRVEGRTFEAGDGGDGARAVVVSRSFAEHWWPGASALGRRLRYGGPDEDWYTIVGVVEDVRDRALEDEPQETVYFPAVTEGGGQLFPSRALDVVVRTAADPGTMTTVLRREMAALNPRIPIASPQTVRQVFEGATARTSFTMTLLGAASGIALLLGLVGIYGVVSYVVSQRTREIGVRMALGATAGSVRGMVVRQALLLAAGGVVLGVVAALALSRVLGTLLFGVSATDPVTYAAVAAALVAVAAVASWVPALRAAGVDPSRALRND